MLNNNEIKISVIIPMYKCADYLDGLFDMVCRQSLKDIEIICVIDGPDEAIRSIVDERAKTDERIISIVQDHRGAGAARNTGLKEAHGKYLLFLDADDLFETHMCEKMYGEAQKWDADVVMCTYTETNEWKKTRTENVGFNLSQLPPGCVINPSEVPYLLCRVIGAPWNKLFKHSLIKEYNLSFSETRMMNDEFFVSTAIVSAKRLVTIHEDLLTVRRYINDKSISSNRSEYTQDFTPVMEHLYNWIVSNGKWELLQEGYYKKFRILLHYNASYDYNEKFAEGVAFTLKNLDPWKEMRYSKLMKLLQMDRKSIRDAYKQLKSSLSSALNTDNEGLKNSLKMQENKLYAFSKIKSFMRKRASNSKIKVSVIVPVYNVGPYIEKCLKSIQNQSLRKIEIIIIDDKSTDNSMEIVRSAAESDSRIRIIKNDHNIGPGPSRNRGIEEARGEYLSFIDSDDYISRDFLKRLYSKATERGASHMISKGTPIKFYPDSGIEKTSSLNKKIANHSSDSAPLWSDFNSDHWSAIYHKHLFLNPIARYGSTRVSEDVVFLLRVGSITKDIVLDNKAKYYYVQRPNSATNTYDLKRISEIIDGLEIKRDILSQYSDSIYVKEYFDQHIAWINKAISKCLEGEDSNNPEVQELLERLSKVYRSLPNYDEHHEL